MNAIVSIYMEVFYGALFHFHGNPKIAATKSVYNEVIDLTIESVNPQHHPSEQRRLN